MDRAAATTPHARGDLRVAAVLGTAAGVSVIALVPYLLQLMPGLVSRIPVPLTVFVLAQALQAALLCTGLAWLGLRMGHRVGLGAPLLQRWINGARYPMTASPARPLRPCLLGSLAAVAIVGLAQLLDPFLPLSRVQPVMADPMLAARNGLLASFYGGIAEELQLRLFLVTPVVWVLSGRGQRVPSRRIYIGAIAVAALAFGIGHLPAAAGVWPLDAVVVLRVVLLNAVGGLTFGWLFWRSGLEMAMLGHFCADLVLHVLLPLSGVARL